MCILNYTLYQPCGCQYYHGNANNHDFCSAVEKTDFLSHLLIPKTNQHPVDTSDEHMRYLTDPRGLTAPKERSSRSWYLICKNEDYKWKETVQRGQRQCPYHDRMMFQLKANKARQDADADKKRNKMKEKAHQKDLAKLEKEQLARQSQDCVVQYGKR